MPQITDLTWQQLETASGLSSLLIVDNTQGLLLRLSALTGAVSTTKNSAGVVLALYNLREYCAKAQITVNTGQSIGERLSAFPPQASGNVIGGYAMISQQIITKLPLNTSGIVGANS